MITCLTCGRALTPGGPACCPKPPTEPPMSDHLDRAAAILSEHNGLAAIPDEGTECECGAPITKTDETYALDLWIGHAAQALDEAGLLASRYIIAEAERRGAVKALRAAAGTYSRTADYEGSAVISWLTDRADRIEVRGLTEAENGPQKTQGESR